MNAPPPNNDPPAPDEQPTLIQAIQPLRSEVIRPATDSQRATPGSEETTHEQPAALPSRLGDYELLLELGRGGMGVVFQARHVRLNRIVALKMLSGGMLARSEDRQRFETEATAAAQLQHPNIVAIYEVSAHEGQPYFSMELVEGGNLAQRLHSGVLPGKAAATYLEQMARAVHYAHQRGIIHRDLKPANILLDPHDQAKITDFGLAKLIRSESGQTRTGTVVGTPSYMAPEQANASKDLTLSCDVYSLGAILYEMITGHPPFLGETALATLNMVVQREPVPPRLLNPGVDRDLETICLKCLEKEPARRYTSAEALAADLRRYQAGEPIAARRLHAIGRTIKWARRKPALAALLLVTVTALLGFALFEWHAAWHEALLRQEAVEAHAAVLQREQILRHLYYLGQMRQVYHAWEDADLGRAKRLLRHWLPQAEPRQTDVRDWEWYYLHSLCNSHWTLADHRSPTRAVAYNPTGRRLASAAGQAGQPGEVKIWDTATGQLTLQLPARHTDVITTLAFSPDGSLLATGSEDATVRLWNTSTGSELAVLRGHTGYVSSLAFRPDGQLLATAGGAHTILLWKMHSEGEPQRVRTLHGHEGRITCLAFRPDGRQFATSSYDETVKLWDTASGAEVQTFRGHAGEVMSVAFSPDGQFLVSGGGPGLHMGQVKLWDVASGKELQSQHYGLSDRILSVAVSRQGHIAAAGSDGVVHLWEKSQSSEAWRFQADTHVVQAIAFHPAGHSLASTGSDGHVRIWNSSGGQESLRLSCPAQVARIVYSPDGRHLASAERRPGRNSTVHLWDAQTGQLLRTWTGSAGHVRDLAFAPDGTWLASAGDDGKVRLHDVRGKALPRLLTGVRERILAVAFCAAGQRLAAATDTGRICLWDVRRDEPIQELTGHQGRILSLAFAPRGQLLASAGEDQTVRLWDLKADTCRILRGHTQKITALVFSPEGSQIASAGQDLTIRIWDVSTAQEFLRLEGANRAVTAIAYHPDGRRLVSVGEDRVVRLWDLLTFQEILHLHGPQGALRTVVFSPDGRYLAAAGDYTCIHVWDGMTPAGTKAKLAE